MFFHNKIKLAMLISCIFISASAHDVLLEVKGAAFVPTSELFKNIYGTCGDFGVELTAGELFKNLYSFGSIDFYLKDGITSELESTTRVTMLNFALGLKYFVPFHQGDFYIGLGVEPSRMTTQDENSLTLQDVQWGCGGIAKVGVLVDLPHSLFTDIFFNYSFVNFNGTEQSTPVNGCLFGIGFGYRFN